ncbi:MAG: septum formation initiator family protein [Acutalibacteraceae bacterium]
MSRNSKTSNVRKRIVFKVAILLLAFYLVYSMISLQTELVAERKVLSQAQEKISSYKVSNKELQDLLKNGSQQELVEKAARDKLGFVYANEEIYEDIKGN